MCPLDSLLGLGVCLVGVVQRDLKLVDVRLQFLLNAERLVLGSGLSLQGGLEMSLYYM